MIIILILNNGFYKNKNPAKVAGFSADFSGSYQTN